jgi:hypothetical protein
MKKLAMALVPFLMVGCSGDPEDANGDGIADGIQDPNNVSVVVPATPKGTVSGQVLSTSLAPLTDVNVALTIGGATADSRKTTTNAEGNFAFQDVPAGAQVLVTVAKQGYASLRATSTVPGQAGNVPINNGNASFGPITLSQLNGSLRFQLVTPTGLPAANARATLEASPSGTIILSNFENTPESVSNVVVEATANAQGLVTFSDIPTPSELARLNGQYRLWVAPIDSNSDGIPETGGFSETYTGSTMVSNSTPRIISLPFSRPGSATLGIENSNVGSIRNAADFDPIRNMVKPGEPIYVFFNHPVQQNSVLVRLTDEYAKDLLPASVAVTNGGYLATITPGQGIQEGKEYNMHIRAVSLEGGSIYSRTGFFFGGDVAAPRAAALAEFRYQERDLPPAAAAQEINDGERVYVNFNVPVARVGNQAPVVQVFFNADIDNNTTIGGSSPGEVGNFSGQGFNLLIDEPTAPYVTRSNPPEQPVFPIFTSTYSTRYYFVYSAASLGLGTPLRSLNPNNTSMLVSFSKLPIRTTDTYETIWGQPIVSDMSATGVAVQPAPTP